tara:strand:+ start:636 stop:854 length:219 start_codon:yes stop_codon:yes gene_type:complete
MIKSDNILNKLITFMHLSIFGLASSEWGIARFATDSFALIALGVLVSLPIVLLKDKTKFKNIWASGNALSNR